MSAYSEAEDEVGGLSRPSKMPCRSWSTPAKRCITGSILVKQAGTICSMCYARKGMYVLPNVEAAMERRFKRLKAALNNGPRSRGLFEDAFVTIMAERWTRTAKLLKRTGRVGRDDGRVFRWHDSGDLHSVEHLAMYNRIALQSRQTRFWLPTKEPQFVEDFLHVNELASNLRVRLSISRVDAGPSVRAVKLTWASPMVTIAGSHTEQPPAGFEQCNAPSTEGHCAECRACWTDRRVSYTAH